jgi:aminopeptidase N
MILRKFIRQTAALSTGAVSVGAVSIALGLAAPTFAKPSVMSPPSKQLVTSQLPRNAVPSHYAINVIPDAENLSFKAQTSIDINVLQSSNSITLNAADLKFSNVKIRDAKGNFLVAKVSVNAAKQTATFTFSKPLKPGKYVLDTAYSGTIYKQANGLFALDYKDTKGSQKRSLFTQFEAPDARRFIPSWDEPNYKATFDLKATVPTDQMAVSNMPGAVRDLGNGKSEVTFQTSPKMSTYLLFFGLGEFDRIAKKAGATEVGVVMGRGNAEKAQYALDASAKIVGYHEDYFGVPFPLPKLDNVAGPGQSQFFSAMENWGAIFTFERILLVDPKLTSAAGKQRIFSTDAHEIAHQWFGNLVTMQWWDDLWLNEGFASWMESKTTVHFHPEWQAELDRVFGKSGAMAQDAYVTTHPVIQKINTVEQTSQAFDGITYQKGEAVITMLEGFAGEDVWRAGIRSYMKKYAYQNTKTDDLWAEIEGAGAKGLTKIAHDFTRQPGVPLIRITSAQCDNGNTILKLTQGEFSRDRKAQTDAKPLRWNVPVIAQTIGNAPVNAIISGGAGEMRVPGCSTLIVNAGQSGYYRVAYQPENIAALSRDFAKLAPIDQTGLLTDSSALSVAEYQDMSVSLSILDSVPNDASQRVLGTAAASFSGYFDAMEEDAARQKQIADIGNVRFSPALKKLGLAQKPSEETVDSNLRSTLIGALGSMNNAEVQSEAKRLFAELDKNPAALDGPLRTTWLGLIAYNADKPTWDKIRKLGQSAENNAVKSTMYRLLGGTKDKALAADALKLALTDEPGATTSAAIINAVSDEHPELAVDFALANQSAVLALVDVASRSEYIAQLASGSKDPAMPAKLDTYAKKFLTAESRKSVDQAIVAINTRIKSQARVKAGVTQWLDEKDTIIVTQVPTIQY